MTTQKNNPGISLVFDNPTSLLSLLGPHDSHIKIIEKIAGVKMQARGSEVVVSGDPKNAKVVSIMIKQIYDLLEKGYALSTSDIERSYRILNEDHGVQLGSFLLDAYTIPARRKNIIPKTPGQQKYMQAVLENDLVFGVGPAGTGKTYLAMALAVRALLKGEYKRIILTRPAIEAGEKIGFLPGDLEEKINPYLRPLFDALHDMVDAERARRMMDRGDIEVAPLAFMRGRTLSEAFVILDEAQNVTVEQMKMFLTRIGYGSKVVVTGDTTQIDLPRERQSGLHHALKILKNVEGISFHYLTDSDVVRHPLVRKIIRAFELAEAKQSL